MFHHFFLERIKKTITVSAQENECLLHNINVSSQKISRRKNLERPEGAIKKNQGNRTREALICIQKFQSQRFLQNEKKTKGKQKSAHWYNYYLVILIKPLQINKSKDQNYEKGQAPTKIEIGHSQRSQTNKYSNKRRKRIEKIINMSNRKIKQGAKTWNVATQCFITRFWKRLRKLWLSALRKLNVYYITLMYYLKKYQEEKI